MPLGECPPPRDDRAAFVLVAFCLACLKQAGAERSSCEKLGLGPATWEQPAALEAGNALLRLPGGGRPLAGGEELRGLASLCCSQTWPCPSARAGLQHGFFLGRRGRS